jgi:hypothetical protein
MSGMGAAIYQRNANYKVRLRCFAHPNLTLGADVLAKALEQQRDVESLERDRLGHDME